MSFLTSYRPNFCCECGEKIVRLRWRVWTSRKFCNKCWRSFVRAHWSQPAITTLGLVLCGVMIGRACRSAPPPLVIQRTVGVSSQTAAGSQSGAGSQDSLGSQGSTTAANATQASPAAEQLYTCGARTKKGTPCSRHVHGPVRCWQHKGMPAMLPQEKLLVKE